MRLIALLGRRDSPTDALDDYCACLAAALAREGVKLGTVRVPWSERGWFAALRWLSRQSRAWKGEWVLVQYTALAWSRRGFPLGFPLAIWFIRRSGAKVAIVFHDPLPFPGKRVRDRARRVVQEWTMRFAARRAQCNITAIPPERVPWMQDPRLRGNLALIPIGSNLPERWRDVPPAEPATPVVVVFTVTERRESEAAQIARILKAASKTIGVMRLIVAGRGAPEAEPILRESLAGTAVQLETHGILGPEQASSLLFEAHGQLFARSGISARRGSVIAGIACGLPIVGWEGEETAAPVTEAGIRTVPLGDEDALVRELVAVLTNRTLRSELRARSRRAAERYFSWESIARHLLAALGDVTCPSTDGSSNA